MLANTITALWDFMHACFCYQVFITPIHLPVEKEYRDFARRACEYLSTHRSGSFCYTTPRHHVVHHFAQPRHTNAKKVLIAHGWMSRAAYMARLIRALHQQGYEVYALDFPAHGEAKGIQLTWAEAVAVLHRTINNLGPFYAVIGHSFGGSMILNTLNLASQFPQWQLDTEPERVVLMSAPTRMRIPVSKLARRLKLSGKGFIHLREIFRRHALIDLKYLDFRHYSERAKTPFLCIHGEDDKSIMPDESTLFCQHYPYASLALLSGADHVSVLIDERVEHEVSRFLG